MLELEKYSLSINKDCSISDLKDELRKKHGALKIALKMPEDHSLAIGASKIKEALEQKCATSLDTIIREEAVYYNSSNFNEDFQQQNFNHLASLISELFEVCSLAECPDLLVSEYISIKLAAVNRRVSFDSSREYTSLVQFCSKFLWREYQILKKAEQNLEEGQMSAFIGKTLSLILTSVEAWLHQHDMGRFSVVAKEIKAKTQIWENSYHRFLNVFDESGLKHLLDSSEWSKAISSVLSPVFGLADYMCLETDERYQSEIADKQKITEVEEKLQSLDFSRYFAAIEGTLDQSVKIGLSLRLVNWISSTERFLAAINKKLQECLRIIEKFYFEEQTELREDPFLQPNLTLFHKFYARNTKLNEIWPHLEKVGLPFAKLNISKKVSVSLQEVLLTKYAEYLGFLHKLATLDHLVEKAGSEICPLSGIIKKLQGTGPVQKKLKIPKSLSEEFLTVNLRLLTKDLRADASKYVENLGLKQAGNNQVLMAVDQHYTQLLYKVDQICSGESEEKNLNYFVKRKTEYEGYPGGKDQAGVFVASFSTTSDKISGVSYWRELIVCTVFTFFMMFAKTDEDKIDLSKLEEDLESLKKSFKRTLKYSIN